VIILALIRIRDRGENFMKQALAYGEKAEPIS